MRIYFNIVLQSNDKAHKIKTHLQIMNAINSSYKIHNIKMLTL